MSFIIVDTYIIHKGKNTFFLVEYISFEGKGCDHIAHYCNSRAKGNICHIIAILSYL